MAQFSNITGSSKSLDSSLKRHTAFIKRLRQSLAAENNEQIMKDIASLSLEKYVDELPGATVEGISRCKSERDVWSAVEVHFYATRPGYLGSYDILTLNPLASRSSQRCIEGFLKLLRPR